jgi:hypothetical protein
VILIGADGEKAEQQSADDAEILQIHGERGIEARLVRQQLPGEGTQEQEPEPEMITKPAPNRTIASDDGTS